MHPEVSVARARVEPGVTTQLHWLSVAEWYVVESGEGLMQVGPSTPFPVAPETDLIFLCVCAPRFKIDCYTAATHQEEYNDVWPNPNN